MKPEVTERLLRLQIQIVSETKNHYLLARDNCLALLERTESGLGSLGSTGFMTESGLCYLCWKQDRAILVGKSVEKPASPSEVDSIQQFSRDLKAALVL